MTVVSPQIVVRPLFSARLLPNTAGDPQVELRLDQHAVEAVLDRLLGVDNGKVEAAEKLQNLSQHHQTQARNRIYPRRRIPLLTDRPELTSVTILFNSISAIGRPKQPHLPTPKAKSAAWSIDLYCSSSASSHRSGRYAFESAPKMSRSRKQARALQATLVPAGMYTPQTVESVSDTLGITPETGGHMRRPSLMQAWRKGSLRASASVMGDDARPSLMATSISSCRRL